LIHLLVDLLIHLCFVKGPPVLECEVSKITVRVLPNFLEQFDKKTFTELFISGSINNSVAPECIGMIVQIFSKRLLILIYVITFHTINIDRCKEFLI